MAYCTQCGTLMHDDDMNDHVCSEEDKPDVGKPIKKGTTKAESISAMEK